MITLAKDWYDPRGGVIFPMGTVFIPQRTVRNGIVYSYATPAGGNGQACLNEEARASAIRSGAGYNSIED